MIMSFQIKLSTSNLYHNNYADITFLRRVAIHLEKEPVL